MVSGVLAGWRGTVRRSRDLWERLVKAYQVQRGPCYLSVICRSPLLILSHLHDFLLTLRQSVQHFIYFRREV